MMIRRRGRGRRRRRRRREKVGREAPDSPAAFRPWSRREKKMFLYQRQIKRSF